MSVQEDIDYLEKFTRVNWGRMSRMWKAVNRIKEYITEPIIETLAVPKAIKKRRNKRNKTTQQKR